MVEPVFFTLVREQKSLAINIVEEDFLFPLPIGRTLTVLSAGGKNDDDTDSSLRLRNVTDNVNIYSITPNGANGKMEGGGDTFLATHGPFGTVKKIAFEAVNVNLISLHTISGFMFVGLY